MFSFLFGGDKATKEEGKREEKGDVCRVPGKERGLDFFSPKPGTRHLIPRS
jgi:hypothetical protein